MQHDPHDSQPRLEPFRKDDGDEAFFQALNRVLAEAALPSCGNDDVDTAGLPIIYIVGAPRSGTTLLSQLLSRNLPVGYINNLIARFWQRPSVGIRLSRSLLGEKGRNEIAFDSRHGVTTGIAGPHEFGYFWRQWLQLDKAATHKLSEAEAQSINLAGLQHALENEVLREFGAPVVFKNVICGFQAALLAHVHPASLFIHIRRDTEVVARSILKCRMERYGHYDAWWSLKPGTYPQLARLDSPASQVLGQVIDCTREFDRELARPGIHVVQIDYEDLIRRPEDVLARVCHAISSLGYRIAPLRTALPALSAPGRIQLPNDLEMQLAAAIAEPGHRTDP